MLSLCEYHTLCWWANTVSISCEYHTLSWWASAVSISCEYHTLCWWASTVSISCVWILHTLPVDLRCDCWQPVWFSYSVYGYVLSLYMTPPPPSLLCGVTERCTPQVQGIQGSNPVFSQWCHTNDLTIGTLVVTLPDAWSCGVSTRSRALLAWYQ